MNCRFVICGVEHTGTTLISDLFRQIPSIDSGFEVGLLLADSPQEFHTLDPFAKNMLEGWGITAQQFATCCQNSNNEAFYKSLMEASPVLPESTKQIFDKTPRYLSELTSCLEKTDVPFITSHKDPRAIVYSDYKRSNSDDFYSWYETYLPGKLQYLSSCYKQQHLHRNNKRVASVSLEDLALNARQSMEYIFDHVGLHFKLEYLVMNNLRYKNTKSTSVSIPIAFAYQNALSSDIKKTIETDFSNLSTWFCQ